jgi:hypothetical protein
MGLFTVQSFATNNKYKEIPHFVRNDTSLFVNGGCGRRCGEAAPSPTPYLL